MSYQRLADRYAMKYGLPSVILLPQSRWYSSFVKKRRDGAYELHIWSGASGLEDFRHEIAHIILNTWLGTRQLCRCDFRILFGDPDRLYGFGIWYFAPLSIIEKFYPDDPSLPSKYSQTHHLEAFADVGSCTFPTTEIWK